MKTINIIVTVATLAIVLSSRLPAEAGITTTDFATTDGTTFTAGSSSGSQVIPDNTADGVGYSMNFATSGLSISDITVSFNLSGGYNGDLYAYLSHGGQISTLLNPSAGLSGSAMNITLVEGSGTPIPTTSSANLSGSYTAYSDLATFNSTDPNGNWTLFFADMHAGDTSTLNSFSVDITAVPEPINAALGLFGVLLVVGTGVTHYIKKYQQDSTDRQNQIN